MKLIFILFTPLVAAELLTDLMAEEWALFKVQHNKKYENEMEEKCRLKIFIDNSIRIAKHNALFEKGLVTFNEEMNNFGDMLHSEFVETLNGYNTSVVKPTELSNKIKATHYVEPANIVLEDNVDWSTKGAVTPVKDQGQCGSCWSFSATGSLEGQNFRKTGTLVSLSEQNLIDCSEKYGNHGCQGGLMDFAFKYVKDNQGIATESSYPYEGKMGSCRYNANNKGGTATGLVDVPKGDEDKLKSAVATVGPVSVAIDASHQSFQFYKSGVYEESACSSSKLDHGVLVVGYGTESGKDYWLVKNSWGEKWGLKGYIKMARNKNNHCGIASSASYPLV